MDGAAPPGALMPPRVYLTDRVLELLHMPRRTFDRQRRAGRLPFLFEVKPRLGRAIRYRADPIDAYLENRWGRHVHR